MGDSKQGRSEVPVVQLVFAVQPPPAELLTPAPCRVSGEEGVTSKTRWWHESPKLFYSPNWSIKIQALKQTAVGKWLRHHPWRFLKDMALKDVV